MQITTSEQWNNHTAITEFILLGFGEAHEFQILLFLAFVVIYILTIMGNILIVILVVSDQHLQTPMYYLLGNFSFLEVCYSSTIVPKMLARFLTGDKSISSWGCFAQLFIFACLVSTECCLLSVMSFDRYVAICKPLHYATIMNGRVVLYLLVGSLLYSASMAVLAVSMVSQLSFCGPKEIDHFFCDFSPLLQLSCSDTSHVKLLNFICGLIDLLPPFILTITSYVCIITAILRISSTTGRQKAFATCSSHLIVVSIFYVTLMIVYILPNTSTLRDLKKFFAVPYTVLTPVVNPLIYSLRNKEVKKSLERAFYRFICFNEIKRLSPLLLTVG
ncbi:olfactory receptor 10A7-like [Eublepharis macularius]|uniref:Olfactory receptor n=1 Tax=Eublepharis macularius TaxID=481883 RepID=A0AA97K6J3_EUBMA|nr:olfactory receptor 10A7-like [Eublepharis macularius]